MTQEDKKLLLKDICARLPYGVWTECKMSSCSFTSKQMLNEYDISLLKNDKYDFYKPYLFPMSSMTEEQKREYNSLRNFVPTYHYEFGDIVEDIEYHDNYESIDYLITNHFDFRGLIPMGLANNATGLNIY